MHFYFIERILIAILKTRHWKKAESLERLDENEKFGKQVFKKSGYVDWKNVYETLYKELCSYIHTAKSLENAKLLFEDLIIVRNQFMIKKRH